VLEIHPHFGLERVSDDKLLIRPPGVEGTRHRLAVDPADDIAHLDPEPLGLTRRESEALCWIAQGKTDGEVASILGVAISTVKKHLEHIFVKLGVENRTAAEIRALECAHRHASLFAG